MTFEARLIVAALETFDTREERERWLTAYLQARETRHLGTRRVFTKTDPATLVPGSSGH